VGLMVARSETLLAEARAVTMVCGTVVLWASDWATRWAIHWAAR
jgi:hypothetical protein